MQLLCTSQKAVQFHLPYATQMGGDVVHSRFNPLVNLLSSSYPYISFDLDMMWLFLFWAYT